METMTTDIADHWFWVIMLIFSATLTVGYERLERGLRNSWRISRSRFFIHAFVAGCLTVFILYDISALGILMSRFPYTSTPLSALRYALDAVMALVLFFLYQTGLRLSSPSAAREILVAVSFWHLLASLWHVLASLEHGLGFPNLIAFAPHYLFPAFYWILFKTWNRLVADSSRPGYGSTAVVAFGLLVVGIFRIWQLHGVFSAPSSVASQAGALTLGGNVTSYLPSGWLWVISIIYGGILVLSLKNLESRTRNTTSRLDFAVHSIVALGVITFGFYILAGYVAILREFPYMESAASSARYLLDLTMAFALMAVVLPSVRMSRLKSVVEVLVAATLFHACSVAWICLASFEHHDALPTRSQVGPHVVLVVLYWMGFLLTRTALMLKAAPSDTSRSAYFVTQAGLMFGFALYRSIQLVTAFGLQTSGE